MLRILLQVRWVVRRGLWNQARTPYLSPNIHKVHFVICEDGTAILDDGKAIYLSMSNADAICRVKCCSVTYGVKSVSRLICMRCRSHHNEITVGCLFHSAAKVVDVGIYFAVPQRFPGVKYYITASVFDVHWSLIWEFFTVYAECKLYGQSNEWRIDAVFVVQVQALIHKDWRV